MTRFSPSAYLRFVESPWPVILLPSGVENLFPSLRYRDCSVCLVDSVKRAMFYSHESTRLLYSFNVTTR